MTTEAPATTLRREPPTPPRPAGCGGDGCDARDPWPLHHVRHRTVFCRLCTSCVLKYHAGSVCVACFELLDGPSLLPPSTVVRCSRCPSVAHSACLPEADRDSCFLCPSCSNPTGFSYFRVSQDGRQRSFDLTSAKVLLAAARLAAASMSRAAVAARAEAERKVKEAAVARKRAREMLERVSTLSKIEKERKKREAVTMPEVVEEKKKIPKLSSTVAAMVGQKRVQNREADRWVVKFHEPMAMVPKTVQGIADDKSKVSALGQVESKERERGVVSGSTHSALVKEEGGVVGRC